MRDSPEQPLANEPEGMNPLNLLADVLATSIELVSRKNNDFLRTSWNNSNEARKELEALLDLVRSGVVPQRSSVSVLFAPTGPLQELSVSSGWANEYLQLAESYDRAERILWNPPAGFKK